MDYNRKENIFCITGKRTSELRELPIKFEPFVSIVTTPSQAIKTAFLSDSFIGSTHISTTNEIVPIWAGNGCKMTKSGS